MKTKSKYSNVRRRPNRAPCRPLAATIHNLILHPDMREATLRTEQHARLEFDRETGGIAEYLLAREGNLNARLRQSDERVASLRSQLSKIREFDRVAAVPAIPFRQWALRDRMCSIVANGLAVLTVCTGAANVYVTLTGAGIPAFVQTPSLCWLLSAIVPSGAFVLGSIPDFLQKDRSRHVFDRWLLSCTMLAVAGWSWCFASEFAGISPTVIDLEGSDHSGFILAGLQLSSELLLGASLSRVSDRIGTKYAPAQYRRTPEYHEVECAISQELAVNDGLRYRLAELAGEKRETEAAREAAANHAVSDFFLRRARFFEAHLAHPH